MRFINENHAHLKRLNENPDYSEMVKQMLKAQKKYSIDLTFRFGTLLLNKDYLKNTIRITYFGFYKGKSIAVLVEVDVYDFDGFQFDITLTCDYDFSPRFHITRDFKFKIDTTKISNYIRQNGFLSPMPQLKRILFYYLIKYKSKLIKILNQLTN